MPGEADWHEEPRDLARGREAFWQKWWNENAGKIVNDK